MKPKETEEWNEIYLNPLGKVPWHSDKAPKSLTKAIKKIKKGLALDICCGAGTSSIYLSKNGFKVKGIDISERAIEIAKDRAKKEEADIDFKTGDALELKEKNKFDFVFDRGCFHHIDKKDRSKFIKKIYNILEKNGRYQLMAFSDRNNFDKSLKKKEIINIFSKYFNIGKIKEEAHTEPNNNRVYLYSALMTKVGG